MRPWAALARYWSGNHAAKIAIVPNPTQCHGGRSSSSLGSGLLRTGSLRLESALVRALGEEC
jgi:hypothetical protein